jgi:hypothetical protein
VIKTFTKSEECSLVTELDWVGTGNVGTQIPLIPIPRSITSKGDGCSSGDVWPYHRSK